MVFSTQNNYLGQHYLCMCLKASVRTKEVLLSTSPAAVLQANISPLAERVPGTAADSVFPLTAVLAELEEKNDHVKCPYLHQHWWSLSEKPPKDHH